MSDDPEEEICDCGSGKKTTHRSSAYGWEACIDCVDEKAQEDIEQFREDE